MVTAVGLFWFFLTASYPLNSEFQFLPSGGRFRVPECRKAWFKNSFLPAVMTQFLKFFCAMLICCLVSVLRVCMLGWTTHDCRTFPVLSFPFLSFPKHTRRCRGELFRTCSHKLFGLRSIVKSVFVPNCFLITLSPFTWTKIRVEME